MSDLIDRKQAIDVVMIAPQEWNGMYIQDLNCRLRDALNSLPSAQPEKTEYISETKAVRSKQDCVDLSERVTATYYDQEHEEWTKHTVTIADVLDSVCDDYTILPYVQPTIDAEPVQHGKWIYGNDFHWYTASCSACGYQRRTDIKATRWNQWKYCPMCGTKMGDADGKAE